MVLVFLFRFLIQVLLQVENEYSGGGGAGGNDQFYLDWCVDMARSLTTEVPWILCHDIFPCTCLGFATNLSTPCPFHFCLRSFFSLLILLCMDSSSTPTFGTQMCTLDVGVHYENEVGTAVNTNNQTGKYDYKVSRYQYSASPSCSE
jgi:hypothetical protein